jgi:uncharacterized protein YbdZ (MbtH family)
VLRLFPVGQAVWRLEEASSDGWRLVTEAGLREAALAGAETGDVVVMA